MRHHRYLLYCLTLALLAPALPRCPVYASAQATPAAGSPATYIKVDGIARAVSIRRDERGIPYIEATAEDDLYYAQGYATAADRLWQMDLLRRTARGELAEVFGRGMLDADKRRRIYGFAALSEELVSHSSPGMRRALEAYARGVNAFIESHRGGALPPEFGILKYEPRPWRAADSLVIGKLFAESLSTSWPTDLMCAAFADLPPERYDTLLPETSPRDLLLVGDDARPARRAGASRQAAPAPPAGRVLEAARAETFADLAQIVASMRTSLERVGLYAEELAASNSWAVAGRRTASGKPMLASDPHLAPSAPPLWHLAHLSAPGVRVAGATVPGMPGIIIGHNEHIAWGVTNLGADVQDLYAEQFDAEHPGQYKTPQGWEAAQVRHEAIQVRRGPADASTETVPLDVTVTRHGPIVFEKNGARYALRWTALMPQALEIDAFYAINRARDWREFRAALSRYTGPAQNFSYADTRGHIGYYGAGLIPRRRAGDGSRPFDGASEAGEWAGFIPPAELPQLYDPPAGIIVTANNRVVGKSYPFYLTHDWSEPYRARRIYDLLVAAPKLTLDDLQTIQRDRYSVADAIFCEELVKLARPLAESSPEWRAILDTFEHWDATSGSESRVMPLAVELRRAFRRHVLTGALGAERSNLYNWANEETFIEHLITARPLSWLPPEFKSYESLLLTCYGEARAELTKRLGPDETLWTWGRTGQDRFPHPLAAFPGIGARFSVAPMPQSTNGSSRTVNAGSAVGMRFVTDTADWDSTRQGVALGESGDPASPHWLDQLPDWRSVGERTFPFSPSAVAKAARSTEVLVPARP